MSTELERLAADAATGDPAARDRLIAESRPAVHRFARRLVDDQHAVDDVVQESLLEVYRSIGTLREPAAYLSWLGLVVRKQADRQRRRLRPTMLLDLVMDTALDDAGAADPAEAAERGEQIELVRRALLLARDADRLLLGLRYYAEWTDAELAGLLGISRGAVRKRLYDARRRLRPMLAGRSTDQIPSRGKTMTEVAKLFGTIVDPTGSAPPTGAALTAPPPGAILPTGIKTLDAVVPWPLGGTVDFLGAVGTGHLVILAEVAHNLLVHGSAALIGVASTEPATDQSWTNLTKLLDSEARGTRATIVQTSADRAVLAVDYAARCASSLAADGAQVLLVVDRTMADAVGETLFDGRVGVTAAGGSVTGVRVAPHHREGEPVPAWEAAGTVTMTSLEELAARRYPAIDVLGSRSNVLGQVDAAHQRVAADCRRVLAEAVAVRSYLTQDFWVAEEHTGAPGESFTPGQAVSGLAEQVGAAGPGRSA